MGWGIYLHHFPLTIRKKLKISDLFLNKVTVADLKDEKHETEDLIEFLRMKIIAAVATTQDIFIDNDKKESLLDYATLDIPILLDELEEASVHLALLEHAIDNPDNLEIDD